MNAHLLIVTMKTRRGASKGGDISRKRQKVVPDARFRSLKSAPSDHVKENSSTSRVYAILHMLFYNLLHRGTNSRLQWARPRCCTLRQWADSGAIFPLWLLYVCCLILTFTAASFRQINKGRLPADVHIPAHLHKSIHILSTRLGTGSPDPFIHPRLCRSKLARLLHNQCLQAAR
jgi:hypothetical protein